MFQLFGVHYIVTLVGPFLRTPLKEPYSNSEGPYIGPEAF